MLLPNTASITNIATYFLLLGLPQSREKSKCFPFLFITLFQGFYFIITVDKILIRVYYVFISMFFKVLILILCYKSLFSDLNTLICIKRKGCDCKCVKNF